jgi:hypothetical protein
MNSFENGPKHFPAKGGSVYDYPVANIQTNGHNACV